MRTLKRSSIAIFASMFVLCFAVSVSAQVVLPRPSQKASVMQRIGATDVTITYSRPGVKGIELLMLRLLLSPGARPELHERRECR